VPKHCFCHEFRAQAMEKKVPTGATVPRCCCFVNCTILETAEYRISLRRSDGAQAPLLRDLHNFGRSWVQVSDSAQALLLHEVLSFGLLCVYIACGNDGRF